MTRHRNAVGIWIVASLLPLGVSAARADGPSVAGTCQALVVDRDYSMHTGVQNLLLAEHLITRVEGMVLPPRLGAERGVSGKFLGIGYRLTRLVLLDNPTANFSRVVLHEVFGHGARHREFNWPDSYCLDWPPPYGPGGGAAVVEIPEGATLSERMASDVGGVEVNNLAGRTLAHRWVVQDRLTYQEGLRGLRSQLDQFAYIQNGGGEDGDDIDDYLVHLNEANAGSSRLPVDRDDLRRESMIGLANPFLWYSAWAVFGAHLTGGRDTLRVPMLRFGTVHYLPSLGYSLSPFGPEFHFENLLRRHDRVLAVDLRAGTGHYHRTWGLAVEGTNIVRAAPLGLDARIALWHQPAFTLGGISERPRVGGLGGLATVTGRWQSARLALLGVPLGAAVELGYKTPGFLEGEWLDRGMILRGGVSLCAPMADPLGRRQESYRGKGVMMQGLAKASGL